MGDPLVEYSVVVISLVVTLAIGFYSSRRGYVSLQEYMLGSRRMGVLPVSLSIAATILTGSSLVSPAQETYLFGLYCTLVPITYLMYGFGLSRFYLPVSYSVKSASPFEFFDRRFNDHIRKFASIIYVLDTIQHTAMSQYVPAVSLSQATGLPTFTIACILSLICVAYTASGGLRAVAWADSFQTVMFSLSAAVLVGVGVHQVGGISAVYSKLQAGSRTNFFDFTPSIAVRYNVVTVLVGGGLLMTNVLLAPSSHQRVVSMPTYEDAKKVIIWSTVFQTVFVAFTYIIGLAIYAYFADCDPVLAKQGISSYAAILPYFIRKLGVPGTEGIFLAGVLAAGLSTTTSCWNTVACTVYEDILKPWLGKDVPKKTSFFILTAIVCLTALISTAFIQVIQHIGSLLEATLALKSVTTTISFLLYHVGMFLPWINTKGVLAGSLSGGGLTLLLVHRIQTVKKNKLVKDLPKILTTAGCMVNGTTFQALNLTTSIGTTGHSLVTYRDPQVPWIYGLSMMFYSVPGILLGLVVSVIASSLTGGQDLGQVDREMIVPQMRWALPKPPADTEDLTLPLQEETHKETPCDEQPTV